VVVYCKTNSMSTTAGKALVGQGYRAIRYLDGGMTGWVAAGYSLR
jgi:rhodanese-related sulfurtransferase